MGRFSPRCSGPLFTVCYVPANFQVVKMKAHYFEETIGARDFPAWPNHDSGCHVVGGLLDAIAQEVLAGESSSGQVSVSQKRKTEFYCAFSILGTIPKDGDLTVIGTTIFDTNVKGSAGAGLKAGIFPKFAGGVFSVAGKVFGHGGKLSGS